jgi:N-acetylmuramoyl-L-alanine amidase
MTRMPVVRVELGYVSNPTEAAKLATIEYQDALAAGLAAGINTFFTPAAS